MCREPARQPFPRSQKNSLRCTNWPCQFETLYIKKARKGLGCLPPSSRPRAGPSCLSSLLPSPAAHPASEPPGPPVTEDPALAGAGSRGHRPSCWSDFQRKRRNSWFWTAHPTSTLCSGQRLFYSKRSFRCGGCFAFQALRRTWWRIIIK